jgi:phage virion morphogenesis protein
MQIECTIHDQDLQVLLKGIIRRCGRLQPALAEMGEIVKSSVQKNFQDGGRPDKWKPSHRVQRDGGQTLRDTGRLMNSISSQASEMSVLIGTNTKYAGLMQFGAAKGEFGTHQVVVHGHKRMIKKGKTVNVRQHTRKQRMPWGTIPARPFLMIQDQDWTEINIALSEYLFTL